MAGFLPRLTPGEERRALISTARDCRYRPVRLIRVVGRQWAEVGPGMVQQEDVWRVQRLDTNGYYSVGAGEVA